MKFKLSYNLLLFFLLSFSLSANDNPTVSLCDQSLIMASMSCSENETLEQLELCIIDYLDKENCNAEVISEESIDICSGVECVDNIADDTLRSEGPHFL